MSADVLLLTGHERGLVTRIFNVILSSLHSFGIDEKNPFSITSEIAMHIASSMRNARLGPDTCADKLDEMIHRPHFGLRFDEGADKWAYSVWGTDMNFPVWSYVVPESSANLTLQSVVIDDIFPDKEQEKFVSQIREALDLSEYSYLSSTIEAHINFCLSLCRHIASTEKKESKGEVPPQARFKSFTYLTEPSVRGLEFSLTSVPNDKAYIVKLNDAVTADNNGNPRLEDSVRLSMEQLQKQQDGIAQWEYSREFVGVLFKARFYAIFADSNQYFKPFRLYQSDIEEFLRSKFYPIEQTENGKFITIRTAGHLIDLGQMLNSAGSLWGIIDEKIISSVFKVLEYDKNQKYWTCITPYLDRVVKEKLLIVDSAAGAEFRVTNYLVRSSINSMRNRRAYDLVFAITNRILQKKDNSFTSAENREIKKAQMAGVSTKKARAKIVNRSGRSTPENKIEIPFQELVDAAPALKEAVKAIREGKEGNKPQRINRLYELAFRGAYKGLEMHTDCSKAYLEFKISTTIPTKEAGDTSLRVPTVKTINESLVITHRGQNPKYFEEERQA